MAKTKPREAWIFFNEQGELYSVKILYSDNHVMVIPVSNTRENTVRHYIRNAFGRVRISTVHILPSDKNHAAN